MKDPLAKQILCSLGTFLLTAGVFSLTLIQPQPARSMPPFARKYGLPCSSCHEAWPKLNSFGQNFRDNGYQLNNERDSPIYQNPSYVPIAMRSTPNWHFESTNRVANDAVPGDATSGLIEGPVNTSGFDLTSIDILTAGTLEKNITFLLVPSINTDGTVALESVWTRFDNLLGSRWLNVKMGRMELDIPLSEKRILTLSNVGGQYLLYHFAPPGDITNDFTMGENQLGIEVMGHSRDSHTRYAVSFNSSENGNIGLPRGRSYDGYLHVSQAFLIPKLGLQRVGAYGYLGQAPTYYLTNAGVPIPGSGRGARSFYRTGAYATIYVERFDVTGIFQHAEDSAYFGTNTPGNLPLPAGARNPIWNGGTVEAHYTYSPQMIFIGRYETERMQQQALASYASDLGNADSWTAGYRWYPFMSSRSGVALHNEVSTIRYRGTAPVSGRDVRSTSVFLGVDFAW
jgi:hypothetical protein